MRIVDWVSWKVILPFALLVCFWPIYKYVMLSELPFEKAFAHGDLLLLAGVLLLEVSIESESPRVAPTWLRLAKNIGRVAGILIIFVFAFIKYSALLCEQVVAETSVRAKFDIPGTELPDLTLMAGRLADFSYFNISLTLVAVLYGLAVFWASLAVERQHRLNLLRGVHSGGK